MYIYLNVIIYTDTHQIYTSYSFIPMMSPWIVVDEPWTHLKVVSMDAGPGVASSVDNIMEKVGLKEPS